MSYTSSAKRFLTAAFFTTTLATSACADKNLSKNDQDVATPTVMPAKAKIKISAITPPSVPLPYNTLDAFDYNKDSIATHVEFFATTGEAMITNKTTAPVENIQGCTDIARTAIKLTSIGQKNGMVRSQETPGAIAICYNQEKPITVIYCHETQAGDSLKRSPNNETACKQSDTKWKVYDRPKTTGPDPQPL